MKSTFATLALAGAAAAAPHAGHAAFHAKKDLFSDLTSLGNLGDLTDLESKMTTLATNGLAVLQNLGAKQAANSNQANNNTWLAEAKDGNAVVNTIVNKGKEDLVFACWGASSSWINANAPYVAVQVPAGKNVTISHAVGQDGAQNTGACSPIFADTKLVNGQVSESWLEFTFLNDNWGSSTYDLSKEVNMSGANMTIEGPTCTSDATRCFFQCTNGENSCLDDYTLVNCAEGSQKGASSGTFFGKASGGCKGVSPTGITKLVTTIH